MAITRKKDLLKIASEGARRVGVAVPRPLTLMKLSDAIAAFNGDSRPDNDREARSYLDGFLGEPQKTKAPPRKTEDSYPGWTKIRYQTLVLHGGRCQCCGSSAKNGAALCVDHIKPVSRYPEFALDINNLQVLCEQCNAGKSAWNETDWR